MTKPIIVGADRAERTLTIQFPWGVDGYVIGAPYTPQAVFTQPVNERMRETLETLRNMRAICTQENVKPALEEYEYIVREMCAKALAEATP